MIGLLLKRMGIAALCGVVMGALYGSGLLIVSLEGGGSFASAMGVGGSFGFFYAVILCAFIVYQTRNVPVKAMVMTMGFYSFFIPWLIMIAVNVIAFAGFLNVGIFVQMIMFGAYFFPVIGFVMGYIRVRKKYMGAVAVSAEPEQNEENQA